ncbi:MAG: hypothetical protein M3Z30_08715, partial [Gemmatimonadota bacterium]|nr:hypothetical protein [Gemmatimonadota bacterium]
VLARNGAVHVAAAPALPIPACDAGLSPRDRRAVATHGATSVSHSRADEEEGDGDDPGTR